MRFRRACGVLPCGMISEPCAGVRLGCRLPSPSRGRVSRQFTWFSLAAYAARPRVSVHGFGDSIATEEERPGRKTVGPRLRDAAPRIVRRGVGRAALGDERLLDKADALVPTDFQLCYRISFLSDASACHHAARHTSWSQRETPRARGPFIVGTHGLCSRGSAAPMPAAASYGIASVRVLPFHAVLHSDSRLGAAKSTVENVG